MTPDELKAALERGTPGPWSANAELITLAVNLAPLFLELWEAAEAWRATENEWGSIDSVSNRLDGIVAALDRLAAEGGGEQ